MGTTTIRTKESELAVLQEAADRLGSDSYCGPWLRETIPFLRQALQSDWIPESAVRMQDQASKFRQEALQEAASIRQEALEEAMRIRDDARKDADRMISAAKNERDRAWDAVRAALRKLEN